MERHQRRLLLRPGHRLGQRPGRGQRPRHHDHHLGRQHLHQPGLRLRRVERRLGHLRRRLDLHPLERGQRHRLYRPVERHQRRLLLRPGHRLGQRPGRGQRPRHHDHHLGRQHLHQPGLRLRRVERRLGHLRRRLDLHPLERGQRHRLYRPVERHQRRLLLRPGHRLGQRPGRGQRPRHHDHHLGRQHLHQPGLRLRRVERRLGHLRRRLDLHPLERRGRHRLYRPVERHQRRLLLRPGHRLGQRPGRGQRPRHHDHHLGRQHLHQPGLRLRRVERRLGHLRRRLDLHPLERGQRHRLYRPVERHQRRLLLRPGHRLGQRPGRGQRPRHHDHHLGRQHLHQPGLRLRRVERRLGHLRRRLDLHPLERGQRHRLYRPVERHQRRLLLRPGHRLGQRPGRGQRPRHHDHHLGRQHLHQPGLRLRRVERRLGHLRRRLDLHPLERRATPSSLPPSGAPSTTPTPTPRAPARAAARPRAAASTPRPSPWPPTPTPTRATPSPGGTTARPPTPPARPTPSRARATPSSLPPSGAPSTTPTPTPRAPARAAARPRAAASTPRPSPWPPTPTPTRATPSPGGTTARPPTPPARPTPSRARATPSSLPPSGAPSTTPTPTPRAPARAAARPRAAASTPRPSPWPPTPTPTRATPSPGGTTARPPTPPARPTPSRARATPSSLPPSGAPSTTPTPTPRAPARAAARPRAAASTPRPSPWPPTPTPTRATPSPGGTTARPPTPPARPTPSRARATPSSLPPSGAPSTTPTPTPRAPARAAARPRAAASTPRPSPWPPTPTPTRATPSPGGTTARPPTPPARPTPSRATGQRHRLYRPVERHQRRLLLRPGHRLGQRPGRGQRPRHHDHHLGRQHLHQPGLRLRRVERRLGHLRRRLDLHPLERGQRHRLYRPVERHQRRLLLRPGHRLGQRPGRGQRPRHHDHHLGRQHLHQPGLRLRRVERRLGHLRRRLDLHPLERRGNAIVFTAQWSAINDAYSYAPGTGSGSGPAAGSGLDTTTITLAANTYTNPGYAFAGWNDGSATYAAGSTYTLSSDGATPSSLPPSGAPSTTPTPTPRAPARAAARPRAAASTPRPSPWPPTPTPTRATPSPGGTTARPPTPPARPTPSRARATPSSLPPSGAPSTTPTPTPRAPARAAARPRAAASTPRPSPWPPTPTPTRATPSPGGTTARPPTPPARPTPSRATGNAIVFTAQWSAINDAYSYAPGTGSGSGPAAGSGLDTTTITLAANTYTNPGYAFAGWNDGSATYAAGSTYTLSSDGQRHRLYRPVERHQRRLLLRPGHRLGQRPGRGQRPRHHDHHLGRQHLHQPGLRLRRVERRLGHLRRRLDLHPLERRGRHRLYRPVERHQRRLLLRPGHRLGQRPGRGQRPRHHDHHLGRQHLHQPGLRLRRVERRLGHLRRRLDLHPLERRGRHRLYRPVERHQRRLLLRPGHRLGQRPGRGQRPRHHDHHLGRQHLHQPGLRLRRVERRLGHLRRRLDLHPLE